MDQDTQEGVAPQKPPVEQAGAGASSPKVTRRRILGYALGGTAGAAAAGAAVWWTIGGEEGVVTYAKKVAKKVAGYVTQEGTAGSEVFKNDAPTGELWELWLKRRWAREASHYVKLGKNVQCKTCPNECLLSPGDRGRCRTRVHKDRKLYTLAYGNPCSFNPDWIEKKPLYHFLPRSFAWSIAVPGCGFRCLNCQNWEISQAKPDETKDAEGDEVRPTPARVGKMSRRSLYAFLDWYRKPLSMFPEDVVYLAGRFNCASIAYTYSEPSVWYEYMYDCSRLARENKIKNVWVTCGYLNRKPLEALCEYIDAANVDLKSFDDEIYEKLNSGKLQPILDTLKTLKDRGVWFEVTNLVVPTYTDSMDMIARMCDWLVDELGPDYPLHFSRFGPAHKLKHLTATPLDVLVRAREVARAAGLRHVYVGNVGRLVEDSGTTFCPNCKRPIIVRDGFNVVRLDVQAGKCKHCKQQIAGVWA